MAYALVFSAGFIIVSVKVMILLLAFLIDQQMSFFGLLAMFVILLLTSAIGYMFFMIAQSNYEDEVEAS